MNKNTHNPLMRHVKNGAFAREIEQDKTLPDFLTRAGEKPLLTPREERALLLRVQSGDRAARNELVERNIRLVVSVA